MQVAFLNGLIAGSIYALIAIGFVVIYRTVRFFHIAHGVVYAVGAYVAFSVVRQLGWHPMIGFFFAVVVAGIGGVAIDRAVYRPLRRRRAANLVYLIASFGVFILVQNLLQILYGAQILTLRTGPVKEGHHILGAVITDIQIIILAVSIILLIVTWLFIQRTRLGKAMRAVADDRLGASVVGIDPERIITSSFFMGSCWAGAAGVPASLGTISEPTMGFHPLPKGTIAAIIGGIGSIPGAVAGGFFLGLVENLGIWKIQAGWKDSIAFGVLILFLLLRPGGIMGHKAAGERI